MKERWIKIIIAIAVIALFALVVITTYSFTKQRENTVIEDTYNIDDTSNSTDDNENQFVNTSSMTEQEVGNLVEEKRVAFKEFIKNIQYYNITDVADGYTTDDNSNYLVLPESFVTSLETYLTVNAVDKFKTNLTELQPKSGINISGKLYRMDKSKMDSICQDSAIAIVDVNQELLTLKSASDTKIEASENIKNCSEDNSNDCSKDETYTFVLEKENDTWKIAKFV